MKKRICFLCIVLLVTCLVSMFSISYADEFDTNIVSKNDKPSGNSTSSLYKYWAYYKTTGTRYVLRVYDWNSKKYIAVPKEYYINHVYGYTSSGRVDTSKQIMYLGVDKTASGKYSVVKSGSSVFTDNTYSHILKWYDNPDVKNFGLTKNDVKMLAEIIRATAVSNGNSILAKNMQNVIDGKVPYDVRAEILFLMKIPGTNGAAKRATVNGKGSIENYSFTFYNNKATKNTSSSKWRKEYITYLEIKAICLSFGDDCGLSMKSSWLDRVACALYEKDKGYVFANNTYQCSCDLYKIRFGSNATYSLSGSKICLSQPGYNPSDSSDRWYMYYTPGRCGIPMNISGKTYYITPGKTYSNVNGGSLSVDTKIKYSDSKTGIRAQDSDYLSVVTNDASRATLYEGWDYITNKMSAILVIGCDKDTGNIITVNNVTYSEFENVGAGTYNKKAWNIDGYEYLGNLTKDDFSSPSVPVKIADTSDNTTVTITPSDIENGVKKQVIFVYEKKKDDAKEARLSIYQINDDISVMYTGKYTINKDNKLSIKLFDKNNKEIYSNTIDFDIKNGYIVNTDMLEETLQIDKNVYEYLGNIVKKNPEYFLTYMGEELTPKGGNVYNLKDIGNNKVHIILGYKVLKKEEEEPPKVKNPELKISYIDTKGNRIPNQEPLVTVEKVNENIVSVSKDLKKDMYIYEGYTYEDSKNEFAEISVPPKIISKEESVNTTFSDGEDRRHIAFVYKKIELKFEVDISMVPNDLDNQLIGQLPNEDYWVLDESGRVTLKVTVTGDEGLTILGYSVKLKIPFDTYMNGNYIKANTVNNLTVSNLSEILVADKLVVPIWVKEQKYDIVAGIEANVEGFGIVNVTKTDDVEVVGRLYDFTVTNIDGSDKTGDEKWKSTLFPNEETEYKANVIPIGQAANRPDKYNYGIKLGTTFYFSVNTKGQKNNAISIKPRFLYVSADGKTVKEVDIYVNDNGKFKNMLDESIGDRYMKLREENVLKTTVANEIKKSLEINKISERYNYSLNQNRNIGKFLNTVIPKYLSMPYLSYPNEFKEMYGNDALLFTGKTENELLTYASHWYGKYVVPSSAKLVTKGESYTEESNYKDGYVIVLFNIISLDSANGEYLSYNLPSVKTQWQRENLNHFIELPVVFGGKTSSITIEMSKDGYAPVIIYQVGVTTKDNNTSVGTH